MLSGNRLRETGALYKQANASPRKKLRVGIPTQLGYVLSNREVMLLSSPKLALNFVGV